MDYDQAVATMCRAAGRDFWEFLILEGVTPDLSKETPVVPIEEVLEAAEVIGDDLAASHGGVLPGWDGQRWPPEKERRTEVLLTIAEVSKGDILAELWWGKWRTLIKRPQNRARVIAWIEDKLGSPISEYGPGQERGAWRAEA